MRSTPLPQERLELGAILVTPQGTPALLDQAMEKLANLPGYTLACFTHEYTLGNSKFAPVVEPGNLQLIHYKQRCEERVSVFAT